MYKTSAWFKPGITQPIPEAVKEAVLVPEAVPVPEAVMKAVPVPEAAMEAVPAPEATIKAKGHDGDHYCS